VLFLLSCKDPKNAGISRKSYISDIEATDTDSRQTGRRIRERRICPEKDG